MLATSERWKSVRESQNSKLRHLLASEVPLIHILGPKGSGKTSLLKAQCEEYTTVTVDANICGSVYGVMSSALRRMSMMKASSPDLGTSESDSEVKDQKEIKSEITIETPDDPTENLFDGVVRIKRKAAEVAASKLAAPPKRAGKLTRRKAIDRFIDEDDSNSDATEEESEGDMVSKKTTSSIVDHQVLKLLQRAQEMRVRGESSFVQKLERVLLGCKHRTVLVIDNIDAVLNADDFDLAESGKHAGSDFLRVLTKLEEYLSFPSQLTIVLVSSRMLPVDITSRCATVHLRALNKTECQSLLSRGDDERFNAFLSTALAVLYPAYSGNFVTLRDTVEKLFESSVVQEASRSALSAKAKLVCGEELRRRFGGGEETYSFDQELKDRRDNLSSTKWLCRTAKLVLIAGYLASHNPQSQDKVLFRTVGSSGAARTKSVSKNTFKRNRLNADSIHIRAPAPFNLNRLLMIYRYVAGTWEEDSLCDSGFLFQRTVRELVQSGIFKSASEDWLKTAAKLNCYAPLDLVQAIAEETNVKLDEVLYG